MLQTVKIGNYYVKAKDRAFLWPLTFLIKFSKRKIETSLLCCLPLPSKPHTVSEQKWRKYGFTYLKTISFNQEEL